MTYMNLDNQRGMVFTYPADAANLEIVLSIDIGREDNPYFGNFSLNTNSGTSVLKVYQGWCA